jgi:hypothetical protein
VREVAPGATSVPLDSGDQAVLDECNSFADDGQVDRSLLVPALIPTWNWRCRETSSGPLCCGTGINAPSGWAEFVPCGNGNVPGQWYQDIGRSLRQYNGDSKIVSKDFHWHTYDLLSQNLTGGGMEILGVGDYFVHELYSTPGDTGHGNSAIIGPWENSWPLGIGHANVPPVYVNQGAITYDQATGGILTGEFTTKIGRWDWASFDDLLLLMDTQICPALGLE